MEACFLRSLSYGYMQGRMQQCGASAIAARCDGHHSVLRSHMQRTAFFASPFCFVHRIASPGEVHLAQLSPSGCCRPVVAALGQMDEAVSSLLSLLSGEWMRQAWSESLAVAVFVLVLQHGEITGVAALCYAVLLHGLEHCAAGSWVWVQSSKRHSCPTWNISRK